MNDGLPILLKQDQLERLLELLERENIEGDRELIELLKVGKLLMEEKI